MNSESVFQEKEQSKEHTLQECKHQEENQESLTRCPKCGAIIDSHEHFCPECGARLSNNSCPKCGAEIDPIMEICPKCGENLKKERCSFCGAEFEGDEEFCLQCGNPRKGIICPKCGTLNFRSFCRVCETPLNDLAMQALKDAQNDPRVQEAKAISEELAQIEEYLNNIQSDVNSLSSEDEKLLNDYKDIIASYKSNYDIQKKDKKESNNDFPTNKSRTTSAIKLTLNFKDKSEAIKAYKEKINKLKDTLNSMIPDSSMTPQMQRDYQSARKISVVVKAKQRIPLYWVCNAFGCVHKVPNECSKPYCGGVWVYEETEEVREWQHVE